MFSFLFVHCNTLLLLLIPNIVLSKQILHYSTNTTGKFFYTFEEFMFSLYRVLSPTLNCFSFTSCYNRVCFNSNDIINDLSLINSLVH